MKNVQKVSLQRYLFRSLITKVLVVLGTGLLLLSPGSASAANQLQYLQWLVQVSGDSGQFNNSSPPSAYVQWAQAKGITPNGGWKPFDKLNREALAHTLVQLLGLNTKKGSDDIRTLAREGINLLDALPESEVDEVSRKSLVFIIDDGLFRLRLPIHHSPHKPPHPPKGPPPHPHNEGKGNG